MTSALRRRRAGPGCACFDQHRVDRRMRLGRARGDDHAFARGQPVRLDDDRRAVRVDVGMRFRGVGERLDAGGRNAVTDHEDPWRSPSSFRVAPPPGSARISSGRRAAKRVDHARGERRFRTDDRQRDATRAARIRPGPGSRCCAILMTPGSRAVPALPGATKTCDTRCDCAIFQARACSRPPPPMTSSFIAPTPAAPPSRCASLDSSG